MKTLIKKTVLLLSFTLLSSFLAVGQETPYIELPPMHLQIRPAVSKVSSFSSFNNYLVTTSDFRFRKEIRTAKQEQSSLYYPSTTETIYVSKSDYLKKMRKAANRSETAVEFTDRMSQYFPNMDSDYFEALNLEVLYSVVRINTFYGYLDLLEEEF